MVLIWIPPDVAPAYPAFCMSGVANFGELAHAALPQYASPYLMGRAALMWIPLPLDRQAFEAPHFAVATDQRGPFQYCLSGQHPVEGVFVNASELGRP